MGKGSSITIGYKYYLGMHMVICYGPVDSINLIDVGDRSAYGDLVLNGPVWYKRWNDLLIPPAFQYGDNEFLGSFALVKQDLYGGDLEEGGVRGNFNVLFGDNTQGQNDYLLENSDATTDNLPAYRGLTSFVLRRCYVSAMTPHLKPWSFKVRRLPAWEWYQPKAAINEVSYLDFSNQEQGDASCNPAHLLYETLTNADWGLGYSTGTIEDDSFKDAADTLYDEEFGMSILLTGQDQIAEFIKEILRHINGIIYTDRETGKFNLKLIRDDYDMATLQQTTGGARLGPFSILTFDESNIKEVSGFQRPSFAEMVNEIVIKYKKRGEKKEAITTFQDSASINIQGGVISQTIDYPGIDSDGTAAKVGVRDLKQHSTPLAQIELKVNRQGWDVSPGDVIRFDWADYGISEMALRVFAINYGDIRKGIITLTCVEDVFGLPTTSYMVPQSTQWTDPIDDPADITNQYMSEATYFEIATGFSGGNLLVDSLTATSSYLIFMGEAPVTSRNYEMWVDNGNGYKYDGLGDYTPEVQLVSDLNYTDTTDIATTAMPFGAGAVQVGSYAYIEGTTEEIVRVDAIDTDNNLVTLGRGCLDTIPAAHAAGTKIWFGKNLWGLDLETYGAETLNFKALCKTPKGTLDISAATARQITLVGRQFKPYPVANVTFGDNDWSFPSEMYGINAGAPGIQLNWVDRNRLSQTVPNNILDWYDGGITVESGVTYDLYLYGELDILRASNPSRSVEPAGGNQYDWSTEIADSNLPHYAPVGFDNANSLKHMTIHAPLAKNEVYRSGATTTFTGSNNITYDEGWAVFNGTDSYIDLCNAVGGSLYRSISFIFNPTDSGNDEQTILGYFGTNTDAGTFGPLMSIGWKRSTYAVILRVAANYGTANEEILGYARPGVNNEIYIEWTDSLASPPSGGAFNIRMNGRDLSVTAGSAGTSIFEKPIVLGCSWNIDESTREQFFNGRITDLRIWRPSVPTTIQYTDIWDTSTLRANRSFRARIVTERVADSVTSLQTFDYTVPQRYGWGLNWGDKWGGRY